MPPKVKPPATFGRMNHARAAQVRERIKAAALIRRLEQIAAGEVTAEPHQVTAALGLLKKVLPDLTATDLSTGGEAISINLVQYGPQPQAITVGPSPRALAGQARKATLAGTKRARLASPVPQASLVPCDITQGGDASAVPCDIINSAPGGVTPDRSPAPGVSLPDFQTGAKIES